jgi:tryptophanyl-tRNA synthetase
MDKQSKKTVFSGIQPSGNLHIGNYLGAISQWVKMQDEYSCIFCVVDYHAITIKQDPKILKKKVIEVAKIYLASGIDPKKSVIFQQSHLSEHTELAWILNCTARMNDLFKMTQFKDKAKIKNKFEEEANKFSGSVKKEMISFLEKVYKEGLSKRESHWKELREFVIKGGLSISTAWFNVFNVGVGLFDYPALMAADILLYNTDAVPVGEDQAQHVELTRTLGRRFNKQFGQTFKVPEVILRKEGARVMGLDDPTKKMSKSAISEYNYIGLTDKPEQAAKKVIKAVTDSGKEIIYNEEKKPAISNLLTIYSLLSGKSIKQLEKEYQGKGYSDFKKDLAGIVKGFLSKFQGKFNSISDKEVRTILDNGADKIRPIAEETMKKVREKIGIR